MKKKLITIVIGAMLCAGLFAGCGQSSTKPVSYTHLNDRDPKSCSYS